MGNEYEKDLEIDKYALDSECLAQANAYMKWASMLADALADRDRADQRLEITKAEVDQDIRTHPENYENVKITEAAVKSLVAMDQRTQDAYEEWVESKHRVGVLMAAKDAFEQRRAMIENLVKLFLSGYWADPRVKGEAKNTISKDADQEQKKMLKAKMTAGRK